MENSEKDLDLTEDPTPVEQPIAGALDGPSDANGGSGDLDPKPAKDLRWRGLRGNKNGQTKGGLWALNRKRQRGLPIDRRTRWGKIEKQIQGLLIEEYGGVDKVTTRQGILISLVALDCARLNEHKRSRRLYLDKGKQAAKAKGYSPEQVALIGRSPKELSIMDGYMQPVLSSLRNNLAALGLEPEKQPEDIFAVLKKMSEPDGEQKQEDGE
jgi:hypothetical protein